MNRGFGEEAWSSTLLPWVRAQRWFPGKGLDVRAQRIVRMLPLASELTLVVVEFDYSSRPAEYYQVPVLVRGRPPAAEAEASSYIGPASDGRHLYDAARDLDGSARLLHFMAEQATSGPVTGHRTEEMATGLAPRPVTTEQSNTSVTFGDRYIMKTLRQLWPGRNPDLALTLALTEAGSENSAPAVAWMSATLDGEEYTLVTVQGFLTDAQMGWPLVQSSLERVASGAGDPEDFAGEAHALGVATGRVHATLAATLDTGTLGDDGVQRVRALVEGRWSALAPRVPELAGSRTQVEELLEEFGTRGRDLPSQRIHNDLHLTQVMKTPTAWVLIDFEGEPNASIHHRSQLVSPWRDVACMLRSFAYAERYRREREGGHDSRQRLDDWLVTTRAAYLDGYTSVHGPVTAADAVALRTYELEKALFEIDYEMTYRPDWLPVAVGATATLLSAESPVRVE